MHTLVLRCFARVSTLYASLLLSLIASAVAPHVLTQVTNFASLDVPGGTLTRPFDVNDFGVMSVVLFLRASRLPAGTRTLHPNRFPGSRLHHGSGNQR
jgi:hypothetical protein